MKTAKVIHKFYYKNDLGIRKLLLVGEQNKDGKYPTELREMEHGEWCGSGALTQKELDDWLAHYGLENPFIKAAR